jgi:GT2 family glycosyltransferase
VSTTSPSVSVIIVGYQSRADLPECLATVADQDYDGPVEIIFVDNDSTDGSADYVRQAFPAVTVIESGGNLGYAGGTNLGFERARGHYLISVNPDTAVERAFVRALVETAQRHNDRALVTSLILYYDDRETVNICGNIVNFGLVATCRGLGEPRTRHDAEVEVPTISGCAFLIPRSALERIGPFEARLHLYLEDTDLALRAVLAGYRCLTAPGSIIYHKYQLKMSPGKFFYIERNRWVVMLRTYRLPTLLLLLPGLLAIEALTWVGALTLGRAHLAAKARSYAGLVAMVGPIVDGRRRLARFRQLPDRAVLDRLQGPLPIDQLMPEHAVMRALHRLVDLGMTGYFALVRRLIRW